MSEVPCPTCGEALSVDERAQEGSWLTVSCGGCGARVRYRAGSPPATAEVVFDAPIEYPPGTRPEGEEEADAYSTLFSARSALGLDIEAEDAGATLPGRVRRDAPAGSKGAASLTGKPVGFLSLGIQPGAPRVRLSRPRTVFGRQGADIDLDDPAVSRHHFQIEVAGGDYFIRDLDSSNGTWVNGERVRRVELLDGDQVRAGKTVLVFRLILEP